MKKVELPTAASLLISEDCNLACKYCFVSLRSKKQMSKEVAKQAIDYLSDNAIKMGDNKFNVMLFGGEPLLNLDTVEYVFDYGFEVSQRKNLRFSVNIVTNATILNDRVKEIINKNKSRIDLQVQLSIDGIKESHDLYRVKVNGEGSFDQIEKNMPGWKDLFKDQDRNISIHGCLNRKNLKYLYESYIYFREKWGIKQLWFMPIHSEAWQDEDVDLYMSELEKIADYIMKKVRETKNLDELRYYAPLDRSLSTQNCFSLPCGAGRNFVTVTAEGKLSPCHQFYFNDPEGYTLIGDVWSGIDELRRKMYTCYSPEDLSCMKESPDCDAYNCYRCIADQWLANGSILSNITGPRCKMSKEERKLQKKLLEEVKEMGLFNENKNNGGQGNNPNNPACLCDLGGSQDSCLCNLGGKGQSNQDTTEKGCFCVSEGGAMLDSSGDCCKNKNRCNNEDEEIIAEALKKIIEQNEIITDLLKIVVKKVV